MLIMYTFVVLYLEISLIYTRNKKKKKLVWFVSNLTDLKSRVYIDVSYLYPIILLDKNSKQVAYKHYFDIIEKLKTQP